MTFKIVDLTHTIDEDTPIFPKDPHIKIERVKSIERDGFNLNYIHIGEHTGTHIGTPLHFIKDGFDASMIPLDLLIVESIVIDISKKASLNRNYLLNICDIEMWEKIYGEIREKCVLVRTGWDKYWKTKDYLGIDKDGVMHFPGVKPEVVSFLIKKGVKIIGIDTHGIDGGMSKDFESNRILFENGGIHIENLKNLHELPERGFYIFLGSLKIKGGSGSPARIIAFKL